VCLLAMTYFSAEAKSDISGPVKRYNYIAINDIDIEKIGLMHRGM
jgi:hypothetical protein